MQNRQDVCLIKKKKHTQNLPVQLKMLICKIDTFSCTIIYILGYSTHPEVIAACCQDGFVGMELLLAGDQGDVTQQAILPLLVEGSEDRVLV